MIDIIEAAIEAGATRILSKNPPDYALMGNDQITKFADIIRRDAIPEGYALVPVEQKDDSERLDFVLDNLAFMDCRKPYPDAGPSVTTWRLVTQDEDENYIFLSGKGKFFKTKRSAIDAAMVAAAQEGSE